MRRKFLVLCSALLGCSSSTPMLGSVEGPDAGTPEAGSGFRHDIVVSMELTVKAGQEKHICQLVALPNDSDANVVSISHEYTQGSHHFLLFTTDLDTVPSDLTD